MNIKGINNQYQYSKDVKNNKFEKTDKKSDKDKLEISDKAKVLSNVQQEEAKKLEDVKNKIDSKFYDSNEVIAKVADKIVKDLKTK